VDGRKRGDQVIPKKRLREKKTNNVRKKLKTDPKVCQERVGRGRKSGDSTNAPGGQGGVNHCSKKTGRKEKEVPHYQSKRAKEKEELGQGDAKPTLPKKKKGPGRGG